jgi:hypothetical protein
MIPLMHLSYLKNGIMVFVEELEKVICIILWSGLALVKKYS